MASVAELQDAFVAGQLQEALDGSRAWLTATLGLNPDLIASSSSFALLCHDVDIGLDVPNMDSDLEAAIAIYMQSIFELNATGDLLSIADVLRITSPVPTELGLIWGSFLAAMHETAEADKFLTRALEKLRAGIRAQPAQADEFTALYETAFEILVSKVILADAACDPGAVQRRIEADATLRGSTKVSLLELLESVKVPSSPAPEASQGQIGGPRLARTSPHGIRQTSPSVLADPSNQVMIGAVAIAAVCAYKYRSQIQASVYDVFQALGDIKSMLLG
ncbi:hypothetical protein ACHHYP_07397 [Achlya hypogyna]|uniref:Uncharacterized protein n=1 Tax=Achlya hypogyna TaxID=1202772 RepID=A0A1V9ZM96_ACHHY|nr:hypothetical protein ACHHYP_07397 [Achlya hypogyna]